MSHAVKWGIISTADINRKVIPGAHFSPKVDLVAVASRDQSRADEYAKQWEIERAYGSYDALLADPEIEAVYISLAQHDALRVVDQGARGGQARALREADDPPCRRGHRGVRRRRPDRPLAQRGVHVPPQPADEAAAAADRRRCDRRGAARPLGVQLFALRRGQHPAAHRRRGRLPDGRRLLQRQRLAARRRRARARLRRSVGRPVGNRLGRSPARSAFRRT